MGNSTTLSKIWYLEQFNLFQVLKEDEKKSLGKKACMENFSKGDHIYLPSSQQKRVYLLKKGHVKITHLMEDGREHIVDIIGPGQIFGKYLSGHENTEETTQALDDVLICYFELEDWNQYIQNHPAFSFTVLKMLGQSVKKLQSQVIHLQFLDTSSRIIKVLLDLIDNHGRKIGLGDQVEVKLYLTHQDIAKLAGTSRQTVTSYLRSLEKEDLLTYNRSRILVKDLIRIKKMAKVA